MIYTGQFADINNKIYKVTITTNSGNQTKSVTLGGNPFVTEMDSDNKLIYCPVKYQSATIAIITPDYNFDIYSPKAQNTKVELTDESGAIVWVGYVTPNLYDMGFVEEREEIEIECIDGLSTLQYIKYKTDKKQVVDFLYLFRKLLQACNCYQKFYVSNNIQLTKYGTDTILDKLYISEENFFDKKEDDETDDEVAWTMQDVLEELCQFLGVSAVADGSSVYFLDYDAIKKGNNNYYEYQVQSTGKPTLRTISFTKTITAKDYSESGATLSLDNVYNKVSIKADLYTFDTVIPDMFGTLENITKDDDASLRTAIVAENGMWGEVVQNEIGNTTSNINNNMIVMVDRVYNPQEKEYGAFNAVFVKYFNNPHYKFFKYNSSGQDVTSSTSSLNYTDTKTMYGATIAKFCVSELKNRSAAYYSNWIFTHLFYEVDEELRGKYLDALLAENQISNVDFSNYIMLLNPPTNHIGNDKITQYPYFQTTVTDNSALFGGANSYLIISGDVIYHYMNEDPYPIPEGECDIREGRFAIDDGQAYILARLQWGNIYWDGTSWVGQETTFKIPFIKSGASGGERRADATMFKANSIPNTVSWRIGTKEKGYLIKMPSNEVISGLPILTVFKPFDPNFHSTKSGDNKGQHYKFNCVFLKDFDIKAIIGDPSFSGVGDTDTIYTNTINDEFVTELKEIKFKIATWDNKKPNYSAVAYKRDGKFQYLDKLYNNACSAGEAIWVGSDDVNGMDGLRQEEHLIYKIVNQYSTPSIILNLSLRNDNAIYGLYRDTTISGKDFIVDNVNIDYKHNKQEIKLIEKK